MGHILLFYHFIKHYFLFYDHVYSYQQSTCILIFKNRKRKKYHQPLIFVDLYKPNISFISAPCLLKLQIFLYSQYKNLDFSSWCSPLMNYMGQLPWNCILSWTKFHYIMINCLQAGEACNLTPLWKITTFPLLVAVAPGPPRSYVIRHPLILFMFNLIVTASHVC